MILEGEWFSPDIMLQEKLISVDVAEHDNGCPCSVHLVELCGTGQYFAMKAMDKGMMLNRNKVCS